MFVPEACDWLVLDGIRAEFYSAFYGVGLLIARQGLCSQVFENWYELNLERLWMPERLSIGIVVEGDQLVWGCCQSEWDSAGLCAWILFGKRWIQNAERLAGICRRGSLPFGDRFGRFCLFFNWEEWKQRQRLDLERRRGVARGWFC